MSPDPVEGLRAALEVALHDFQSPTPVVLNLDVGRERGNDLVWVSEGDGSSSGLWVEGSESEAELLVRAADFLQDQVFDQLGQTWGEARPPCPGHQHAADPVLVEGEAWWVCSRTHERIGRIGELG